jgi:hypothetical protein
MFDHPLSFTQTDLSISQGPFYKSFTKVVTRLGIHSTNDVNLKHHFTTFIYQFISMSRVYFPHEWENSFPYIHMSADFQIMTKRLKPEWKPKRNIASIWLKKRYIQIRFFHPIEDRAGYANFNPTFVDEKIKCLRVPYGTDPSVLPNLTWVTFHTSKSRKRLTNFLKSMTIVLESTRWLAIHYQLSKPYLCDWDGQYSLRCILAFVLYVDSLPEGCKFLKNIGVGILELKINVDMFTLYPGYRDVWGLKTEFVLDVSKANGLVELKMPTLCGTIPDTVKYLKCDHLDVAQVNMYCSHTDSIEVRTLLGDSSTLLKKVSIISQM